MPLRSLSQAGTLSSTQPGRPWGADLLSARKEVQRGQETLSLLPPSCGGAHGGPCSAPGRAQEASPQALKAFRNFYPTVGLPEDMKVMLPKSGIPRTPTRPSPSPAVTDFLRVQAGRVFFAEGGLAAPPATPAHSPVGPPTHTAGEAGGAQEGVS